MIGRKFLLPVSQESLFYDEDHGYQYKFIRTLEGIMVKRTKIEGGSWNNGLLTEFYNSQTGQFAPYNKGFFDIYLTSDLNDATWTIQKFIEQENA
jgi:hypothetical protein